MSRLSEASARTIWFMVADLHNPAAEPFMVLRADSSKPSGDGISATVESLHWDRDEAEAVAAERNEREVTEMADGRSALAQSEEKK